MVKTKLKSLKRDWAGEYAEVRGMQMDCDGNYYIRDCWNLSIIVEILELFGYKNITCNAAYGNRYKLSFD